MSFPASDGPSSLELLKQPKALHHIFLLQCLYFKLFILEPQPPCL